MCRECMYGEEKYKGAVYKERACGERRELCGIHGVKKAAASQGAGEN